MFTMEQSHDFVKSEAETVSWPFGFLMLLNQLAGERVALLAGMTDTN